MVNVEDLIGPALDYAVAMARGRQGQAEMIRRCPMSCSYRPSTDGAIGMDVIDSEGCFVEFVKWQNGSVWSSTMTQGWEAAIGMEPNTIYVSGPTLLVAAMRCFVKFKLGDIIEIPEELQ